MLACWRTEVSKLFDTSAACSWFTFETPQNKRARQCLQSRYSENQTLSQRNKPVNVIKDWEQHTLARVKNLKTGATRRKDLWVCFQDGIFPVSRISCFSDLKLPFGTYVHTYFAIVACTVERSLLQPHIKSKIMIMMMIIIIIVKQKELLCLIGVVSADVQSRWDRIGSEEI